MQIGGAHIDGSDAEAGVAEHNATHTRKKKAPGRPRKSLDDHVLEGTFRRDQHGPLRQDLVNYRKKPTAKTSATAKSQSRWIKNASDERAVRNGCRFNEGLAVHVVDFFRTYLKHSKGQWAGQPFELLNWQRDELIYPLFGWVRPDGTRRFRRSYIEIPKKNGKSTLASGIGIYGTMCDEEPGAEVFSLAADRDQASIVHGEAMNMVEASEELAWCMKINRSTKTMSYKHTRSFYRALSSTPGGKEGLNIHFGIIDELHVWRGRELWDALQYAYRSRRQPLQFVITTAGSDMQSICRHVHDRAVQVAAGEIHDDSFFPLIYSAAPDDDWTDSQVWEKANPSLQGGIIQLEDFQRDCDEAVISGPATESAFKRYSLNIWATTTTPWIKAESWRACRTDYAEHDLEGFECYAGLDLAKTRDTTAFAMVFPVAEDDGMVYRLLMRYWLPEEAFKRNRLVLGMPEWVQDKYLTLTDGEVCDYSVVANDIIELCNRFQVNEIAYDPYNAEHLTQQLEEKTGVPRIAFGQTITNFAEPTAEFERLIIAGDIQHSGNPVLDWQVGNVTVKTDVNNNKRPVKPPSDDHRKIDGVVAVIMALARSMSANPDVVSVYEDKGLVTI